MSCDTAIVAVEGREIECAVEPISMNAKIPNRQMRLGICARYRDLPECHGTDAPFAGERAHIGTLLHPPG